MSKTYPSHIDIYMTEETKKEVSSLCNEIGISMSSYYNMLHEVFKNNKHLIKEQLCKQTKK